MTDSPRYRAGRSHLYSTSIVTQQQPFVNSRRVHPADHVCDISCGIIPDDCPACWPVPVAPTLPPRPRPDHLVEMLGRGLSRLLREPVEDMWAMVSDRPLPGVLYDVRSRPADDVMLGLTRMILEGPLREILKDIVRETLIEELPGALVALDLLPDTTELDHQGGAD